MKRLLLALVAAAGVLVAAQAATAADNGNAPPTLSFFSGGGGAHAGWVHTDDQPPGDFDQQAIQIHDTTDPYGYAGVLIHHVYGMTAQEIPNPSYDFQSNLLGPSMGSPRLVVLFSDGARAELRPLTWQQTWTKVTDNNWDLSGGPCIFHYETTWNDVQTCETGAFITNAYITTDPGVDVTFLIDNLYFVKLFSNAGDNSNGDNTTATYTPDLLQYLTVPLID